MDMHIIYENNSVHEIGMHFIFCTKYRKNVFIDVVEIELKNILCQTCAEYGWKVQALETMPDHVHIFLQIGHQDRPVDIVRTLKSISAVYIFTKFPELKGRKFWGSGLWSNSTYYGSVGNISEEVVKKYIENQKNK